MPRGGCVPIADRSNGERSFETSRQSSGAGGEVEPIQRELDAVDFPQERSEVSELTPIVQADAERTWALEEIRRSITGAQPAPMESLAILESAARLDTGGSQAARSFLFWLAGREDPTGYRGNGGLELRRLDRQHREAAFNVLEWWAGGTASDEPLYGILRRLRGRFESSLKD